MSELNECFIYLIAHRSLGGSVGPVKVGITGYPEKRLAALQTGNPSSLEIVFKFSSPSIPLARHAEGCFHAIAKDKRLSGEWFDLSPLDALATLIKLMAALIASDIENPDDARAVMDWSGVFKAVGLLHLIEERASDERG